MNLIRNISFNLFLVVWAALYTIAALPILLMPLPVIIVFSSFAVRIVLLMLKLICGITYEVRGKENIPDRSFIVASKHQSPLETFILMVLFKRTVFILKKELLWLPFIGLHFFALKMIFIDRKGGSSVIHNMTKTTKLRLKEGRTVVIFPEGTRVAIGQKREYKSGIAFLYSNLSVPVLPIALNTGLFWPRNIMSLQRNCGKVIVEILPPIYPGLTKKDFLTLLQNSIEERSILLT
ncbi:lysophospholipid acyltransferase family protein [Candidatus Mesenet endosymbiont of Phosphuga atrata]|uniref:lysophospholipid acyltransferase family protein n=1 Tax=Candidatus Mesenet endosymbiont of Phosphuga atrata TaxID=3066221 RepID=UPI0030CD47A7